jgi:class 3 adenylate cyclase
MSSDGVLVEFASAIHAVRCAVSIQRELDERRTRPLRSLFFEAHAKTATITIEELDTGVFESLSESENS